VLPLEGANGLFLQVGQSVNISPRGELSAAKQPELASSTAPPPITPPPPEAKVVKKSNTGWIILGLAGGAAVAAGAGLAGKKSSTPVSP
jgi:hypothetical protein